jgi:16S rRNA C967 or C1407 C5-methylase (RsmB/RsmF family)
MHRISEAVQKTIQETITDPLFSSEILDSILHPPSHFYLRLNLSKMRSQEILNEFSKQFLNYTAGLHFNSASEIEKPVINDVLHQAIQFPIFESTYLKDTPNQIMCDKFAAEAVMMGADLFVPGVKDIGSSFKKGEPITIKLFLPQNHPFIELKGVTVASGDAAINSSDFPKQKKGILVTNTHPQYYVFPYRNCLLYDAGYYTDQTFGAMVAVACIMTKYEEVRIKHPTDQLQIFDLCSAPGHKTSGMAEFGFYLSSLHENPRWPNIISIDRSSDRLQSLRDDIPRLGLKNISIFSGKLEKLLPNHPEFKFLGDFVLFDPPCSALGTRPKLFLDKTQKELDDYPLNQRRLLKIADQFVKPGGYLMYNTCTIPKAENEGIVAYAVDKLGYQIVSLPSPYSTLGEPGVECDILNGTEVKKLLRFYPRKTQGHGYFIALMQKSTSK